MTPVMQTVTGRGGNCFAACLASILELPITAVPNFFDLAPDEPGPWWKAVRDWLRPRGFGIITLSFEDAKSWDELCLDGYHIVSGKSPRLEGAHHSTVWHRGRMVHDPHPDQSGIPAPVTLEMLYPLDPGRLHGNAGVPVDRHEGISPIDADGKTQAGAMDEWLTEAERLVYAHGHASHENGSASAAGLFSIEDCKERFRAANDARAALLSHLRLRPAGVAVALTTDERTSFEKALRDREGPTGDTPGYPGQAPFHWDEREAAWWGWNARAVLAAAQPKQQQPNTDTVYLAQVSGNDATGAKG
jgi:hypothetical protein